MAKKALDFEQIKKRVQSTRDYYASRNALWKECEDVFFLDDPDAKKLGDVPTASIRTTLSTDGRDKVLGGARLLSASEPKYSVPFEENNDVAKEQASKVEKFCSVTAKANDKQKKTVLLSDVALSSMLYSQIDISITPTRTLAEANKDEFVKEISDRLPLLFDVLNPKFGYPIRDRFGLAAYATVKDVLVVTLKEEFGADVDQFVGEKNEFTTVTLIDYWDRLTHCVYIDGQSDPIYLDENTWGFVPFVSVITEGSNLFTEPEKAIQPLLTGMIKSGFWKRKNSGLTALYTMIFSMVLMPQFLFKESPDGDDVDFDYDKQIVKIKANSDLRELNKKIDPVLLTSLEMASKSIEESTYWSQATGQPLGANAPFSMVSLLQQAGRLFLVQHKRLGEMALGEMMAMGLRMLKKQGGGKMTAVDKGSKSELKPSDIPDVIEITATLETDQAAEKRMLTELAAMMKKERIASTRFVREMVGIGQPDAMQEEIWAEDEADLAHQFDVEERKAQLMQKLQAQQQNQAMQMQAQGGQALPQQQPAPQSQPIPQAAAQGRPMTEPVQRAAPGVAEMLGGE